MLKDKIKDAIEEILTASLGEADNSVSYAKDKVDEVFGEIENVVYSAIEDIEGAETIDDAKNVVSDLQNIYDEL